MSSLPSRKDASVRGQEEGAVVKRKPTIQELIDAAPVPGPGEPPVTVHIPEGVYTPPAPIILRKRVRLIFGEPKP